MDLRYVHTVRKRLRNGSQAVYRYAWRGGPRLTGEPGTAEFLASYQIATAARSHSSRGTVHSLVVEFRGAGEFRVLRDSTRRDYSRYLDMIADEFGTMPLEAVSDHEARGVFMRWRDGMADHPRKADMAWTVLARMFKIGKDRGRILSNPCERGGRLYTADRIDRIWTEAMIGAALAGLPAHLRWAFMLALWTGQRQGDLLRLPWSAMADGRLRVKQSKTGRRLLIPIGEPLLLDLATIPQRCPVILTSTYGKPWTGDGFRASWGRAVDKLGIAGVTFHDLRGSSVTRLAEAGCTESEIGSITGHSHKDVGAMLDRHYLSRTNVLAENAIRRLERLDRERRV